MALKQRMRIANEKASKYITMRGNVPKSSVSKIAWLILIGSKVDFVYLLREHFNDRICNHFYCLRVIFFYFNIHFTCVINIYLCESTINCENPTQQLLPYD